MLLANYPKAQSANTRNFPLLNPNPHINYVLMKEISLHTEQKLYESFRAK
jgi:hypothetical protein